MATASYHTRILSPKYGQTDNVKSLTANRSLPFAPPPPLEAYQEIYGNHSDQRLRDILYSIKILKPMAFFKVYHRRSNYGTESYQFLSVRV